MIETRNHGNLSSNRDREINLKYKYNIEPSDDEKQHSVGRKSDKREDHNYGRKVNEDNYGRKVNEDNYGRKVNEDYCPRDY